MDMVRLILAKAMDEERPDPQPQFYCTPDEYLSEAGRGAVAARVTDLFEDVKRANADVFSADDRIGVGSRVIADVVTELQPFQLVSPFDAAVEWDIMGHAYEQYTSVHLRRERGQFFTNRLAIDLLVAMVRPDHMDVVLDPAGGSGGFLTGVMRYVRNRILATAGSPTSKERQLGRHRANLFLVESTRRLVRVAKTAMILNGDGHAGMTAGDSLGEYSRLERSVIARAGQGMPDVILTNPPFAGVGEGRITNEEVLARFETGHRWSIANGDYRATDDLLAEGAPPELLFFERCLDWLKPGGRMGIVLPKSFLDTSTYRSGRELLFRSARLVAAINCHKDTFQPHTGTRTCLLVIKKLALGEVPESDYPIFMAISRRIGQNSEGEPIYKRDAQNAETEQLDEDLGDILSSFEDWRAGNLVASQYVFSIKRSELDEQLRINPQLFLPHLNKTLKEIESIDGVQGWSAVPLDQIAPDVRIFKGPRLKSENLIVEEYAPGVEPYFTPGSMLQEKGESAKLLQVNRANKKQLAMIEAIRVRRGDVVISRSGTIGRVAVITERNHNAIVSDDLIRVRTGNERLQQFLFGYLQSRFAQDQMMRNEYGAIQQHLEPQHIRDILVPWPEDERDVEDVVSAASAAFVAREELDRRNAQMAREVDTLVSGLIRRTVEELVEAPDSD